MKKLGIISVGVALLVAAVPLAFAADYHGKAIINYIKIFKSSANDIPVYPCGLEIVFTDTINQYILPAKAQGTQINLALLEAFERNLEMDMTLDVGSAFPGGSIKIKNIYLGGSSFNCPDADGDGYSGQGGSCGEVDRDDNDPTVYPNAPELCDGRDNDGNGQVDEGGGITYCRDADGDGYGDPGITSQACSAPPGYVNNDADCNDANSALNPGTVWYSDADGDGYGDPQNSIQTCAIPPGYVSDSRDCDDSNTLINPGTIWYADLDGDGYGDPGNSLQACSLPSGCVNDDSDCDDSYATINPATVWYKDTDGDRYSDGTMLTGCTRPGDYYLAEELADIGGDCDDGKAAVNPEALEAYDGADNDCDGQIDEGVKMVQVPGDYATIQAAINAVYNGDAILVHDGTYRETINFRGKAVIVKSANGAASTIINGNAGGSVVTFVSGEGPTSILDGFTITNGSGSYSPLWGDYAGGGIICYYASPTITNCAIKSNKANLGGGIYGYSAFPAITNCNIKDNTSSGSGGGIYCHSASPAISNCTISGNISKSNGGGIYGSSASPTLTNCTIGGNKAKSNGGGIYAYFSSPRVVNGILWGDTAAGNPNEIYVLNGGINITYSTVQGSWGGEGNINTDPLFAGNGDYHLAAGSPCIDTGSDAGAPDNDIDGDPRPLGAGYDIGSDEYSF